jgi:SAM-dependent methyltransferase
VTEPEGYGDWRSLELAIKDAAKKAARLAGPGVSAATVDAQIRQARYDRFLSRVFARGEQSEWLLKGGMSMLARVPRARTTKDVDLAALHVADLADAEAALTSLVAVNLSDHLTFRLVRSMPTGLGDNQPEVATRRYIFACLALHNIPGADDRNGAVAEALRVLRQGGRLLLADAMHTDAYAATLRRCGAQEVAVRALGWRVWYGGPWFALSMVTARKP